MAAAAILKNRKIAISRLQLQRFQRNLVRWRSSTLVTVWSVTWNLRNPRWRRSTSWKSKNYDISATVWPIGTTFGNSTPPVP